MVVLDASSYRKESLRQLSDQTTYHKLRGNPTDFFKKELLSLLDRAVSVGIFTSKDKEMLIPTFPVLPIFHHLPKLHKGLTPLTGRPIVADIDSLNERLGKWLDQQLQPLVNSLPGYLQDTKKLLYILDGMKWDEDFCWISCDVSSLYSSIPHNLGLQAVAFFLDKSGQFSLIEQEFIIMCLEYLLTH